MPWYFLVSSSSVGSFFNISYVFLFPNMVSTCFLYVSVSMATAVIPLLGGRMVMALFPFIEFIAFSSSLMILLRGSF